MPVGGMAIPWTARSVPHATLDLLRGCNIACPGCFNLRPAGIKPVAQIAAELRQLMAKRRLRAVTLLGGEPTLHPDLLDIVRHVAAQNLQVALLTNGCLLTPALLAALKRAGLWVVWLHIQRGQQRSDLSADADAAQWRMLRQRIAQRVADGGLDVGFSVIAYRSQLGDVADVVREVITSPIVHLLLVTEFHDVSKWGPLTGDVDGGIRGVVSGEADGVSLRNEEVVTLQILRLMAGLGLRPFAYLGSSENSRQPRWLNYVLGVVRSRQGRVRTISLRAALSDRLAARLVYGLSRHVHYDRMTGAMFRAQLVCNALSGGALLETWRLLLGSCQPGARLYRKRLTFQEGPSAGSGGRVMYCRCCPDATVLNGRLVPVCLADRFVAPSDAEELVAANAGQESR